MKGNVPLAAVEAKRAVTPERRAPMVLNELNMGAMVEECEWERPGTMPSKQDRWLSLCAIFVPGILKLRLD